MDLRGLVRVEVVAVTFTPLVVAFGKGCAANGCDTLGVPEGDDKIYPLLTAVFAGGTVEPAINTRKGLIQQCNKVIGQRCPCFGVQIKLPVQGF